MNLKEEFKFFVENCTKSPRSFENYSGGLKTFVSERLRVLVDGFTDIYDYDDPDVILDFIHILEKDKVFVEKDRAGGRMYSNSIASYLNFLYARNFFSSVKKKEVSLKPNESPASRQQIYYGAPGTGKSFRVKQIAESGYNNFVRTTFHPDSDYSTFVGAYKPTMGKHIEETLSIAELKAKLFEQKLKDKSYACHKFATNYWYSLSDLKTDEIKEIISECGYTDNYIVEVKKGIAIGREVAESKKDRIVYKFVPQAFLQAYVEAWKLYAEAVDGEEPKAEYLVIEEINRGNCAQIFGDLFQLLDRNEYGFSEYFINADQDLSKHLSEELSKYKEKFDVAKKERVNTECKSDVVDRVLDGKIMLLPSNLYIMATMNTSDQSLFPIDSAFKRRWDWVYVPIANVTDKNWRIVVGNKEYGWWDFLEKINEQIGATTNSEDKKLGFFFCQANDDMIDTHTFVNKVLFYLWNDVFKDYGFDGELFMASDGKPLTFDKFHDKEKGEKEVQNFLDKLIKNEENKPATDPVDPKKPQE